MRGTYADNDIGSIRDQFAELLLREQFVTDKTGVLMLEIPGASFLANEETIFDEVNRDYVAREIAWYESQSLYVQDIPDTPAIWKAVATPYGMINSNYGYLIHSAENGSQFKQVLNELKRSPISRRAVMIYTRPSMHFEYCHDGMSDFICTNAVQYLLRDGFLDVVVQMRSNDVRFGYRNDRAWQVHVQRKMVEALNEGSDHQVAPGNVYWQVGSLHVYEKDFFLVDWYARRWENSVKKSTYREAYPDSPWSK